MRASGLKGRSLITLAEFNENELLELVGLASKLKAEPQSSSQNRLRHRNMALIFLMPSYRTRASFAVAASDEGANTVVLSKEDLQLGRKESIKDVARTLGRIFDAIVFRGSHAILQEFAHHAGIPVWNGLTESYHPTQVIGDLLTIKEHFGSYRNLTLAFVGDGLSSTVNSLAIASLKMGIDFRVVAPKDRQPSNDTLQELLELAGSRHGSVAVMDDIKKGVEGADIIYGDTWISMGQEDLTSGLIDLLKPYRITSQMMELTGKKSTAFLHCLPALHDGSTEFSKRFPEAYDVDDEVFNGAQSLAIIQAENRMHAVKALMILTMNG